MEVVFDMTKPTDFISFSFFSYDKYMKAVAVYKFTGDKENPTPLDSTWEQQGQMEVSTN